MGNLEYEVTHIAIKNLSVVWRKAQRSYDEKWAKKIANEFDPDKFEPVTVTLPNGVGVYHIVEGQHRTGAAAIFLGDVNQKIPCHVIGEADPARAAEVWLGINQGRKRVRPVVEFLVAVEAKRDTEVAVNNIVRKAGYVVSENYRGENVVSAVNALRKVYKIYGASVLVRTLNTCRTIWDNDSKGVAGAMITGLGMFVNEFHGFDVMHLRKVILKFYSSPWKFLEACKMEAERSSETLEVAMSELVRMKYNKGLRDPDKRLHRKEKP